MRALVPDSADNATHTQAAISFLHLFKCIACADGSVTGVPVCNLKSHSRMFTCRIPHVRVHVKSGLPIGAGLGSSAAFAVCVAAALLDMAKIITPLHRGSASTTLATKWFVTANGAFFTDVERH